MRTPEQILKEGNEGCSVRNIVDNLTDEQILNVIKDAQIEAYNQAIEDAAENADTSYPDYLDGNNIVYDITVDKYSILKLKKSVSCVG